jgi:hypothetical protein
VQQPNPGCGWSHFVIPTDDARFLHVPNRGSCNFENMAPKFLSILCQIHHAMYAMHASCGMQRKTKVVSSQKMESFMGFPCFPHFPSACVSKAPPNEPANFSHLLQTIHGIPGCHKA